MYATMYVNTYPDDIQGLVLSEPGGFTDEQVKDYLGRVFKIDIFAEWLNDATWDDQFLNSDSHEVQDYRFQTAVANEPNTGASSSEPPPQWRGGAVCNKALQENTPNYDWTRNLSAYTTPVLFMYSEKNTSYGLSHAQRVSSAYPNVRLEMVPDVGHDMEYNGFDEYYAFVLDYLNSLGY